MSTRLFSAAGLKTFSSVLALPVSVAALAVSLMQTADLREQFEMTGPVVTVSTQLQLGYKDDKKPVPQNRDDTEQPIVDFTTFETYELVWLRVSLTNNGRSDTAIQNVRMEISPDNWVDATAGGPTIWCTEPKKEPVSCTAALPFRLQPASSVIVHFPVHAWRNNFSRTKFGRTGIPMQIYATGLSEQPLLYQSQIRIQL